MGPGSERDQARFYAKVALPNEQGCMLWLPPPGSNGYGKFWLGGRWIGAHRFSYELAYGPIPDGLTVDHVRAKGCRHRHCVAPAHLEAVTMAENNRRSSSLTAENLRKTHCPQEHAYDDANTYIDKKGKRSCRKCHAAREYARNHGEREC
jgi:hypothetical protein